MDRERYRRLIAQEAQHWGSVQPDPQNPQIWQDERLFEIFFGNEYRYFVERIGAAGTNVLELGCGEGRLAIELARRGHRVTAIDLSPDRIKRANDLASLAVLDSSPTFKVGDLNTTSLPKKKFDCIVAHDALHHLYNLDHVLDEAYQALKPAGNLIVIDYVGMAKRRKLAAALLFAALPTYKPYRAKWQLRGRLGAFLASESNKREALESGSTTALHCDSPFEEISQRSIVEKIRDRFMIVDQFSFCPFWFYLAPKVRLPRSARYRSARLLKEMDDELLALGVMGAYVFIEAQKM